MLTTSKLTWQKKLRGADLTHTEFRVLMVVSTYADGRGRRAYPGLKAIAADALVGESTARRALKTLVAKGWLKLVRKGGNEVGYRVADEYELADPTMSATPSKVVHKGATGDTLGAVREGCHFDAKGVISTPLKGVTGDTPSDHYSSDHHPSSDAERRGRPVDRSGSRHGASDDTRDDLDIIDDYAIAQPPAGHGWNDLIEDVDLLEEWLEDHLDLQARDYSTVLGMWESGAHPRAIFNTIRANNRRPA